MSDSIDRQKAIDTVHRMREIWDTGDIDDLEGMIVTALAELCPAQRTGRWIPQDYNKSNGMVSTAVFYYPKCSECGHSGNYDMNFCPNCGADMRGEQG